MALYCGNQKICPIIKVGGQEISIPREINSSGQYLQPQSSFVFTLPSEANSVGANALLHAFYQNTHLTKFDFNNVTEIFGGLSCYEMCRGNTSLTEVNAINISSITGDNALYFAFYGDTSLSTADLSGLTIINGANCFYDTFFNCPITSIDLSNVQYVQGNTAMAGCFYGTRLSSLSFNSLKSNFYTATNVFTNMLGGVADCTVHFPSNLQSVIGSWGDVTTGFGGIRTTVLFDLPATT